MISLPPILPVGTQVVTKVITRRSDGLEAHSIGSLAVVIQAPSDYWHAYRVRFADGFECSIKRPEFSVLAEYQNESVREACHPLEEHKLFDHVIFRCVIGSRAYGLDDAESDTDRRGVYLPLAALHWSLYGVPEQLENDATQEVYWEVQKFVLLALKANPNVLECLYSPLVEQATDLAKELIDIRGIFLSKLVYQTYTGYVMSQFKKLQAELRNRQAVKWKHVMHLIRLLLAGIAALRQQTLPVHVGAHRERLLSLKHGEIGFEAADAWRLQLHAEFESAYAATKLPPFPDYTRANDWLLRARKSAVT